MSFLKIGKQVQRALVDKDTIDVEKKQFHVVFATETPCYRSGWEECFNEVLVCNKKNIRTQRMDNGVLPLLDNHNRYEGVSKQYGSLISYTIKDGELRGLVQFSTREELNGIWNDIVAGIIKGISVSYRVWAFEKQKVPDGETPTYRAIDWEPVELSLAPVPFDFNSAIRSDDGETNQVEIKNLDNNNQEEMANETTTVAVEEAAAQRSEGGVITPPATVAPNVEQVAKDAVAGERKRVLEITSACRAAKLDEKFLQKLINDGTGIDAARAMIIDQLAAATSNSAPAPVVASIVVDEVDNTRNAMSDALMNRAAPGSVKVEGKAQDFRFMSMLDMARHCLTMNGENGTRFSPNEAIKRAIATTDYPNLLTSTVERSIRRTYDAIVPEWKMIAKRVTAKDFREKTGIAVDGKVDFEEIAEGGEYKHALLLQDDSAKIKLKTYGKMIKITRQTIINDDLGVFDKLPSILAYGAADFQAAKVWGLITGNAKTPDGKALFHSDHGNLASGAGNVGAPTETLLSKARTAMRRQTTPLGKFMPTAPKFLLVPFELQTTAEKLMTSLISSAAMDVNTMKDKFSILTSPYLQSAVEWYLLGDTSVLEGLVYAYLEGEEGLFIDKEVNFNDDTISTKGRLDFDAAVWDHRFAYKNPGA